MDTLKSNRTLRNAISHLSVEEADSPSVKMEEALECSTTLRSLVMKTLESNEEIARRLDSMQAQMVPPSIDAETRTISQGEQENEAIQREALGVSHMDTATDVRATSAGFAFDRDLQSTRVYGRVAHRNTSLSLPSSTGQSRGWSLSELTLSDVSNISIVSLPISVTALYDGESYQSYHQDRQVDDIRYRKSRTPCIVEVVHHYTVSSIDIAEAAALWPPCSIELWMYKTHLDRSILEQFFSGGELNGHAILLLQFKHLANIVPQLHQRRRLWGEIQRLQSCIFDETLKLEAHGQCSSGMINPHTIAAQTATGKQDTSEFLNINEEYLKHLDCARAIVRQSSTTGKSEHSDTKGEVYLEQTVEPVHGPRLDTWQDGRNLVGFPSERIVSPQKPLPRKPSDFDPLVEQIIRANASADERNRTKKIERSIIVCLEKSRSSQLLGAVFDYNLPSPEIAKHC